MRCHDHPPPSSSGQAEYGNPKTLLLWEYCTIPTVSPGSESPSTSDDTRCTWQGERILPRRLHPSQTHANIYKLDKGQSNMLQLHFYKKITNGKELLYFTQAIFKSRTTIWIWRFSDVFLKINGRTKIHNVYFFLMFLLRLIYHTFHNVTVHMHKTYPI